MNEEADMQALDRWIERACAALEVDIAMVDRDVVLALAGRAAHGVVRPAAPVTTYLAGFIAGRAAAAGKDATTALDRAVAALDVALASPPTS